MLSFSGGRIRSKRGTESENANDNNIVIPDSIPLSFVTLYRYWLTWK